MKKNQEYKELSDKDLRERLEAEQLDLIQTKIYHSTTPLDNSGSIREKRRNIARIQTDLRARELKKD
jgi:large subunit ribosomal protein L29